MKQTAPTQTHLSLAEDINFENEHEQVNTQT